MAITTTSFEIVFRLDTKVFEITDTGVYSGATLSDISSSIIITDPSGDVTAPLEVSADISLSRTQSIAIPLTSAGEVMQGQYTFSYTAVDSSDSSTAGETKTFDFCYKSPTAEVEMTYDCIQPKLTATDVSDYRVGGVTPTVSRSLTIHYPIAAGADPLRPVTTDAICTHHFYTQTHTGALTSDLLYDHTNGIYIRDIVSGAKEVNVVCDNTLCDLYCCLLGMYSKFKDAQSSNRTLAAELEAKWLRAESIRSLIKDSYECNKEENVADLVADVLKLGDCQPGCGCSEGDEPTLIGAISSTTVIPTTNAGGSAGSGSGEVNTASDVGSGEGLTAGKVAEDLQFKSLVAGANVQLTSDANTITISSTGGSGASGSTVVVARQGVAVTSDVNGTTTTYTVGIDQATWNKINALRNSVVVAGTGVTVDESINQDGEAVYTVNSSVAQEDSLTATYRFKLDGFNIPTIELVNEVLKGDKFQRPTLSFVKKEIPRGTVTVGSTGVLYNDITDITDLKNSSLKLKVLGAKVDSNSFYIPTSHYAGVYNYGKIRLPQGSTIDILNLAEDNYIATAAFGVNLASRPVVLSSNEFIISVTTAAGGAITYGDILRRSNYFYFTIKLK